MTAVRYVLAILLTGFSLLHASLTQAQTIDQIIVFGDSLSDNGNLYTFTKRAHAVVPYVPVLPKDPPYYQGRFTNGSNWIDVLGTMYNVPVDDYAYGGSWAEPFLDSKLNIPFGLDMQMDDYFLRHPLDTHRDKHLYIIWSGSNDYAHGRDNPDYATTNAVASIRRQIEWLIDYGAKQIFVLGVPDLSLVPEVRVEGEKAMAATQLISYLHNKKLLNMIEEEKKAYRDVNLMVYDIVPDFDDIYYHPDKYNLKVTLTACYNGGFYFANAVNSPEIEAAKKIHLDLINNPSLHAVYTTGAASLAGDMACSNPDDYLFFDTIHPTRVVHRLIAEKAYAYMQTQGIN